MKALALFLVLSCSAVGLWAQAAPQTPAPPPPGMHHPRHDHMMAMHKHMQDMQAQVANMRATLEKMKANLSRITDPAVKQQAQLDVDLWESMVQHMEGMAKMMSGHAGMGMGTMGGVKETPSTEKEEAPKSEPK